MNGKRIGIGLILLSVGYLIFNVAIPFWLWLKVVSVIVSIIGVLIGLAFIGDALSVKKRTRSTHPPCFESSRESETE